MNNSTKSHRYSNISNLLNLRNRDYLLYITGIHSNDKRVRICNYLLHQLALNDNLIGFNKHALAKKFNCSVMTVSRAINAMKRAKHVSVFGNTIRLIYKKGDLENGNK